MNLLSKIKKAVNVLTSEKEIATGKVLLPDVEVLGGEILDNLIESLSKIGTNDSNEISDKRAKYVPHTHKLPEEKKEDKLYVGCFINNIPYTIAPEESKYLRVPTIVKIAKSKCISKKHALEMINNQPDMPLGSFREELINFHDYKVYYKRHGSDEIYTPDILEEVLITSGMEIRVINTKERIPKKRKITHYINGYTICKEVTNVLHVTFQDILDTLAGCYRLSNINVGPYIDTLEPQNYTISIEYKISNNIKNWEYNSKNPNLETVEVIEGMRFTVTDK